MNGSGDGTVKDISFKNTNDKKNVSTTMIFFIIRVFSTTMKLTNSFSTVVRAENRPLFYFTSYYLCSVFTLFEFVN